MIQFYLYIVCLILILCVYLYKRNINSNQYKNIVHIPSIPLIGSAYLLYHRNGREFYQLMNNIFKKYGDKFVFEFELRKYYAFSARTDVQVRSYNIAKS